jgi:hypothetical protein
VWHPRKFDIQLDIKMKPAQRAKTVKPGIGRTSAQKLSRKLMQCWKVLKVTCSLSAHAQAQGMSVISVSLPPKF